MAQVYFSEPETLVGSQVKLRGRPNLQAFIRDLLDKAILSSPVSSSPYMSGDPYP